jgi:hypothetical protein
MTPDDFKVLIAKINEFLDLVPHGEVKKFAALPAAGALAALAEGKLIVVEPPKEDSSGTPSASPQKKK